MKAETNNKKEAFDTINFKASDVWLDRFLHRHNIVRRSVTNISQQKIQDNVNESCKTFFKIQKNIYIYTVLLNAIADR